ncbi:MAG: hypothetical protein PUJ11_06810, partial [Eubacteriaceae bacterium]|nr:hypothetical protein [Eubacteriaceae bacterium]
DFSKSKERARILASIFVEFVKWPRLRLPKNINIHRLEFLYQILPNILYSASEIPSVTGKLTYILNVCNG